LLRSWWGWGYPPPGRKDFNYQKGRGVISEEKEMSDEAVKKRLQRAIRAAMEDFRGMGFEAERIYHPFFHIQVNFINKTRRIHISLDSVSASEKQIIRIEKKDGSKEIWLRRKGIERFDKFFF
jgi:hypothetical protein